MSHEDTLILEIDADVYAKIAAIAAREGTDIDRMIRDMVRESIAEAEAQKSPDRTDTPGFTAASLRRRARDNGDSE